MLKSQDIVILLQVHCLGTEWTYSELAKSLKMSSSPDRSSSPCGELRARSA